jgi:succinoglycan biosynthesis protein ExoM
MELMDTEISVCIATHRRPSQLEQLLTSLVEQEEAPPFEVIIVENDCECSAKPVVDKFRGRLSLTYLVEPVRGLARVRNRAVAASNLKYLAFIDDDHSASPRWLASHYRIAIKTNASAVIGKRTVVFDQEVPDFIRACGHFDERPYSDGEIVPWYHASTGNCMIRRDALPHLSAPFSTSFNLTGGEDVDLFYRMVDNGARIVAAAQARTVTQHPASRANLFWVMRRALRNGGTFVEICWGSLSWRQRMRAGWNAGTIGAKSVIRAGRRLWHRDKTAAIRHLISACTEFGKIARLLGIRIKEYRHHH